MKSLLFIPSLRNLNFLYREMMGGSAEYFSSSTERREQTPLSSEKETEFREQADYSRRLTTQHQVLHAQTFAEELPTLNSELETVYGSPMPETEDERVLLQLASETVPQIEPALQRTEALDNTAEINDPIQISQEIASESISPEENLLQSLNLSPEEQQTLDTIRQQAQEGIAPTPTQQQVIGILGKRLEAQGAETVKTRIVSQYPDIPQITEMSPKQSLQFAEQYEKVQAIYNQFKSVEGNTGMLDSIGDWYNKTFKGRSLLNAGKVGEGLEKLKSGQLLTEEEMSTIEEKMNYLDGKAKIQIYQKVIADMLERMVPGMNLSKDGFTGEALTADAINTIAVLAMLVSAGGSMIANMGIKAQRIANGIIKADIVATGYGIGEGTVGLVDSVETGNTSGMALNGAVVIMSALGLRAGIKGTSYVAHPQRMDMSESYQAHAQGERHENFNLNERQTINETFPAWEPRFTNATPEQTGEFVRNIGPEMVQAQGQVAQVFDGIGDKWTLIGSGAVNRPGLKRDDVDINFAKTYTTQIRARLEELSQRGEVFMKQGDGDNVTFVNGYDFAPDPFKNGTPRFAFWTRVEKPDGTHQMVEVEMFGEGIRHTDGKTIGITQITGLEDVNIVRHQVEMPDGQTVTINRLNETGIQSQYAYNLMTEFRGDTLQSFRELLAQGKAPKAKDLMRLAKMRELGSGDFNSMREIIERAAQRYDKPTVDPAIRELFKGRGEVYDLMKRTQDMYTEARPLPGRGNIDVLEAQRYLDDFPTLFDDLGTAKLEITRSFDSLGRADSIEELYRNFAQVRDRLVPFEGLNQFLRTRKPDGGELHFMATERYFSDFVHDYVKKAYVRILDLMRNKQPSVEDRKMLEEIEDAYNQYMGKTLSVNP